MRTARLRIVIALLAVGATGCNWNTWGYDVGRQGTNRFESTIGVSNASGLHEVWSTPLGAIIDTSPVVADGVDVDGTSTRVAYVGTEHGLFAAIRVSDGKIIWQQQLESRTVAECRESPDNQFGITSGALIDGSRKRVYVAPADGKVHALDLATGAEAAGWPVTVTPDPQHNFVLGALNLWNDHIYVGTASHCDEVPYEGKVVSVDINTAAVAHTFYITGEGAQRGGSVWGWGGVSVDVDTGHIFAATGNANLGTGENFGYADAIVRLTADLDPVAFHKPPVSGFDDDFGSTPVLFQRKDCPPQLTAERKDGSLFLYDRDRITPGPVQTIPVAGRFNFIGLPAFDSATNMLYVANPSTPSHGLFVHGMLAFELDSTCRLSLRWQTTAGVDQRVTSTPTVANGVVYYGDGPGNQVHAFNAKTGELLWSSTTVTGAVFAAPIVIDGVLLAGSWDGSLHAWKP